MEESRLDRIKKFGLMHAIARNKAGKSQEYMAAELCVSKKTIQNWEKGISSPSFFQSLEWFRILNINPFPHYLTYVFPDVIYGLKNTSENERIEEAFEVLMQNLSINSKRALIYLFFGEHGSSATAILQLVLAHLHLPIKDRIAPAQIVFDMYEMEKELGNLICPENIQPDLDVLNDAIYMGKASAKKNEKGYGIR